MCGRRYKDIKLKVTSKARQKKLACINDNTGREFQLSICWKSWPLHSTMKSDYRDTPGGKVISGVTHSGSLHSCTWCLVCRDDISARAHDAARHETDMCNAYNKSKALLEEAEILLTRKR